MKISVIMPKTRNIIIFAIITAIFILLYLFFVKKEPETASLVSLPLSPTASFATPSADFSITQDFLTLLLNVKNIKLDDSIFIDQAFESLRDSSITLIPDGNEGRPN